MSDMQKVRVTLTDADGKVHEVVGWNYGGDSANGVHAIDVERATYTDVSPWYIEIDMNLVPFTVIQELPTGLGAVVKVAYDNEDDDVLWTRFCEDEWIAEDGVYGSTVWLSRQKFTVLSEGVK